MLLSVQLYTLRDAIALDQRGVLSVLADMGLRYVELAGQYRQGQDFIDLLKELGLKVSGSHVGMAELDNEMDLLMSAHEALDCRSLTMPFIDPQVWREDFDGFRDRIEKHAVTLAKHGFDLSYHNHDFEIPGDKLLELFRTSSRALKAQFDVAWIQYGGGNPTTYIREFGPRVYSVHLKDTTGNKEQLDCIAGTGIVDWDSVLSVCSEIGVPFGVIEMDHPPGYALDSVKACFEFFQSHPVA